MTATRDALVRAARTELAENGEAALSLRAVARRAGLSHAAPGHFFGDRRGLMTAVAIEGFDELAARLAATAGGLEALGRAYVDFGAANPALIDVMFRRSELRSDDAELQRAQTGAIAPLLAAVEDARGDDDPHAWTLVSWAFVHGLVVLGRERALAPMTGGGDDDRTVAHALIALYSTGISAT